MSDFAVGDRVIYTSGKHGDERENPLWNGIFGKIIGTVVPTGNFVILPIAVNWDNGTHNTYRAEDLTLYEHNPIESIW